MPTKEATRKRREREIKRYSTIFSEGKYTLSQINTLTRRILDGLNESEWQKLERNYKLPSQARHGIDASIGGYWDFRFDYTPSREKCRPKSKQQVVT
jgi:hypothetical protein